MEWHLRYKESFKANSLPSLIGENGPEPDYEDRTSHCQQVIQAEVSVGRGAWRGQGLPLDQAVIDSRQVMLQGDLLWYREPRLYANGA